MKKADILKVGDLVVHKVHSGYYSERMIILSIDQKTVKCRYWNDAQKKYTLQEFLLFELEIPKKK